jgi:ATP-dependent DNA ligase
MLKYRRFKTFYPPRPANAVPNEDIIKYDNGEFIYQPKLNGSNCVVYTNGEKVRIYNRRKERMSNFDIDKDEILKLYDGDGEWSVFNGEYMNKSKLGENGLFNHKFVLFDILVDNGKHLTRTTFKQRLELIDKKYTKINSDERFLDKISDSIYIVKSYYKDFKLLFDDMISIDMYEGGVIKKINGKLENGVSKTNTSLCQLKSRKPTKNYKY